MKNSIFFLMMFAGLVFTSCEPMDDIHEDVDARLDNIPVADNVEYTLTEEDYTETVEDGGLGLDDASFDSIPQANELLPDFLSGLYPALGEGSIVEVAINISNPARIVGEIVSYEVTEEDYAALGFDRGNFNSEDDMIRLLQEKNPDAEAVDAVELTYLYYANFEVVERTTTYVFVSDSWTEATTLEDEDYTAMGESYPNFSSRGDAVADLSTYLGINHPYAEEGDEIAVLYDLYAGGETNTVVDVFTYDGSTWTASGDLRQEILQFGHNGEEWEPDNTIVYTLTTGDYDNGDYANFNYWDEEDIQIAFDRILVVLEEKFPDVEEGQKFLVNYVGYSGSTINYSVNVIYRDGEFVIME